ncbi:MAG TPA: FAD:protein FMN transferase [Candidatus Dormibacteraeota bacterium]|nr:FAD:protein FMN transferase [Candidatus Dormibacteraeota bacterium]
MPLNAAVESHHFAALGTDCSLFAAGRSRADLLAGEFWVRRLGARLTRFSADSELSQLNAAAGRWFEIGEELEALLRASLRAFEMSAGFVNIAVLPSMLAIGYTRPLSEGATVATLEAARPLKALPDVLSVRRGAARVGSGSALDLGGIAKGWMADGLCEALGPNALANLGGDLSAVGAGPAGNGWPVAVAGATLMLRGQGAATSSVSRRSWDGFHHLIDPRTGLPARTGLAEVSVVAADGLEAEVVAKTALLVGPELAPAYCAAHALAWWLGPADDD